MRGRKSGLAIGTPSCHLAWPGATLPTKCVWLSIEFSHRLIALCDWYNLGEGRYRDRHLSTLHGRLAESAETKIFVGAVFRSVDRLVSRVDGLRPDQPCWCLPATGENSLDAPIAHVLGNPEENFIDNVD